MISVVFGSLSGILDGIFVAAKKSRIVAISAIIGAVANIVLNIILVYSLGPIGAAISTLVSYVLVWVCRIFAVRRVIKLKISIIRDIASYFLLILESVLFFINGSSIMLFILQLLCFVIIIILYFKDFENLIKKLVVHLKKRKEQ
jgi:O-antigen/teichoic acid export membrane protein